MADNPIWSLERYRPLLRLQARSLQLNPRLRRRFDESDLVNETLMRAHAGIGECEAETEAKFIAWLQQILRHVLIIEVRKAQADKRDVRREVWLERAADESAARLEAFLVGRDEPASAEMRREESRVRISAAVDRLEPEQRDACILHYMEKLKLAEIALRLDRSEKAVSGLLYRGKKRLKELLADVDEGDACAQR